MPSDRCLDVSGKCSPGIKALAAGQRGACWECIGEGVVMRDGMGLTHFCP